MTQGAFKQDNSYYDMLHQRLSFGQGGVDDGEDADVIIHELSHGLHQWLTRDGVSQREGIAEGFGDYVAVSYSRTRNKWKYTDPQYNWVFGWDVSCQISLIHCSWDEYMFFTSCLYLLYIFVKYLI